MFNGMQARIAKSWRRWARLGTVMLLLAQTAVAWAGDIRVLKEAGSPGPAITLSQMTELDDKLAPVLGDVLVAEFDENQPRRSVTIEEVREALSRRGVNWARVNLIGFSTCTVHRLQEEDPVSVLDPAPAPAGVNPDEPVTLRDPATVYEALKHAVAEMLGESPDAVELRADPGDRMVLDVSILGEQVDLSLQSISPGRVRATIHRPGATQRVVAVGVSVRRLVVVSRDRLRRGEVLSARSLDTRERLVAWPDGEYYSDVDEVMGKLTSRTVEAGTLIVPAVLAKPLVVRRNAVIEVSAQAGGMLLSIPARAMSDGAIGDVIEARNLNARSVLQARVTGPNRAEVFRVAPKRAQPLAWSASVSGGTP